MKIDNQIVKEKSNKDMLEELKCQSDRMWEIIQEVSGYTIKIDNLIEKYEKECQEDE